ncbi:hypothetical protein [Vibrio sp. WXL103]|uniref:hypothetical protein n=1 Tax=unclassified Vibrio TaxID=2614977 RepID=UPI003EC610EC
MKKVISRTLTSLLLVGSASAFAFDSLPNRDQNRIGTEVNDMQAVLNLTDSQAQKIRQAKADLTKSNNELIRDHGRGTAAYKEARKPVWAKYQKDIFAVITREELQRYNQSK